MADSRVPRELPGVADGEGIVSCAIPGCGRPTRRKICGFHESYWAKLPPGDTRAVHVLEWSLGNALRSRYPDALYITDLLADIAEARGASPDAHAQIASIEASLPDLLEIQSDPITMFRREVAKLGKEPIPTWQLRLVGRKFGYTDSTIKRWVVQACEAGWLTCESRGNYRYKP